MKKKRFVIEESRSGKIISKEMKLEEAQTWLTRLQELARHNKSGRLYRITDTEKPDA